MFVLWHGNHRRYQDYLRHHHPAVHERLVKQDRLIESFGEWIRWPVGSAWLLLSIFKTSEIYGDTNVGRYKQRAVVYFVLFLGAFAVTLGTSVLTSR